MEADYCLRRLGSWERHAHSTPHHGPKRFRPLDHGAYSNRSYLVSSATNAMREIIDRQNSKSRTLGRSTNKEMEFPAIFRIAHSASLGVASLSSRPCLRLHTPEMAEEPAELLRGTRAYSLLTRFVNDQG
jgi:hypothetical protein